MNPAGLTALDMAKQGKKTDIVQLLERYQNNPKETQKALRNELNLKGKKTKQNKTKQNKTKQNKTPNTKHKTQNKTKQTKIKLKKKK